MSSKTMFISDPHFSHKLMARLRGFSSVGEMNEVLIKNWNARIGPSDIVRCLGDFHLGPKGEMGKIRARLNGQIHLILGNHDRITGPDRSLFASIRDADYIKVEGQKIYLHHYACRVWRSSHHGSWHLYGHSHGSLPDDPHAFSCDVGCDVWGLSPVSFEQLAKFMSRKEWRPIDHHGIGIPETLP